MKKSKHYNLKTIEDISKMVNEKNIQNFLIDFSECLLRLVVARKKSKLSAKDFYMSEMEWIDDGKHKLTIKIKKM
jgi:hypothetical protein